MSRAASAQHYCRRGKADEDVRTHDRGNGADQQGNVRAPHPLPEADVCNESRTAGRNDSEKRQNELLNTVYLCTHVEQNVPDVAEDSAA